MKTAIATLIAWACFQAASSTFAQTLYRCGADGRQFSDKPCTDGRRVEIEAQRPSRSDMAAAREVARRETELAERLRRENEARNKQQAVADAAGFHGAPASVPAPVSSSPALKRKKVKSKEPAAEKFTAVAPQSSRAKKP